MEDPSKPQQRKEQISPAETELKSVYPDPIPVENTHEPVAIVSQRKTTTGLMYLVKYKNGEMELLEESDVSSTLVAQFLFEKKKKPQTDLLHEMIKLFLETIKGFIQQIEKNATIHSYPSKRSFLGR